MLTAISETLAILRDARTAIYSDTDPRLTIRHMDARARRVQHMIERLEKQQIESAPYWVWLLTWRWLDVADGHTYRQYFDTELEALVAAQRLSDQQHRARVFDPASYGQLRIEVHQYTLRAGVVAAFEAIA